ncbi:type II secretion system F family protein [Candidatus Wolfebacteria bacterium]|nr:type II secretion system F family protein [Candidatus Wolfebacteria bacterium]
MNKTEKQSLGNRFRSMFIRVSLAEKILFAKHLAMMITSGMTVAEGLKLVRRQIKSRGFGRLMDQMLRDIEGGQFLSDSLRRARGSFGDLFINIVRIGEMSGSLATNLEYLAVEMRKSQQLRSKVISAMIYPLIILIATLAITVGLLLFVFPKILPILATSKAALPLPTRMLIATGDVFNHYSLYLLAGMIGVVVGFFALRKISPVRYFLDGLTLRIPVIGTVAINYNMATVTRTLGILLKSQIKVVEAVGITGDVLANKVYKDELKNTALAVERGEPLYKYWEKNEAVFPGTVTRMVEVGEKTGNLESNLNYLAQFYENEVDDALRNLSTALEPVLLIVMGLMVGFIALAIIMPIYGITQTAQ